MDKTVSRAKDLAYRYLALRSRSRAEMAAYLARKEVPPEAAETVIAELASFGYIDDARFASSYAKYLVEYRGLSPYAIKYELRRKGVPDAEIEAAIEGLSGEDGTGEEEVALRIAGKKMALLAGVSPEKARRRLTDYLRRKGYSFGIIRKIISSL